MRFKVKVGREFPCYMADVQSNLVTVNISQPHATTEEAREATPKAKLKHFPWWAIVLGLAALTLVFLVLAPPIAYGAVTGDYAQLQALAQSSGDLLRTVIHLLRPT